MSLMTFKERIKKVENDYKEGNYYTHDEVYSRFKNLKPQKMTA